MARGWHSREPAPSAVRLTVAKRLIGVDSVARVCFRRHGLGNGSDGITVCWNHDVGRVCLQRASGHVLDGIFVPGCNDEASVPLVCATSFRGVCEGHSTLRLLPLAIHVESKREERFVQALCLSSSVRVTRYLFSPSRIPLVVLSSLERCSRVPKHRR